MKLNIDSPCSADWSKMALGVNSRHCEQCDKNVIDFRNQSREEILEYVLNNPPNSVCGRFKRSQIDFHHQEDVIIIKRLVQQKRLSNQAIFYLLAIGVISLSSCSSETTNPNTPSGGIKEHRQTPSDIITYVEQTDTVTSDIDSTVDTPTPDPDWDVEFMGEVCVPTPEPMGKVVLPDSLLFKPQVYHGPDTNEVYQIAEIMPEFPGGLDALTRYLNKELSSINDSLETEGKVYVNFIVDRNGSISDIKFLRVFDEIIPFQNDITKVVEAMPKWKPGEMQGKIVNVRMTIPIRFELDR